MTLFLFSTAQLDKSRLTLNVSGIKRTFLSFEQVLNISAVAVLLLQLVKSKSASISSKAACLMKHCQKLVTLSVRFFKVTFLID